MSGIVLDAGALIAVENNDRKTMAIFKAAKHNSLPLRSNGAVIAEVWRGGVGRQVPLARFLAAVEVVPVDQSLGRAAGVLIKTVGSASALDATVVAMAAHGDHIMTSDEGDIKALIAASGREIIIVTC